MYNNERESIKNSIIETIKNQVVNRIKNDENRCSFLTMFSQYESDKYPFAVDLKISFNVFPSKDYFEILDVQFNYIDDLSQENKFYGEVYHMRDEINLAFKNKRIYYENKNKKR